MLTGTASLSVYHFWAVWIKVLLWCCVGASFLAICTCHVLFYKTWTLRTLDSSTNPERGPLLPQSDTPMVGQEEEQEEKDASSAELRASLTKRDPKDSSLTPTQRLLGVTYLTPLVPAMPLLGIVCTMHMLLGESRCLSSCHLKRTRISISLRACSGIEKAALTTARSWTAI